MRGLMFNYLLSYIDETYGYDMVDTVISKSNVSNDGAYSNAGLYEDKEFIELIKTASTLLEISLTQIQVSCGKYSFGHIYEKLITLYDQDIYKHTRFSNAFEFISMLEVIHYKEVVKLYPDSDFPHFDIITYDESMIEICYRSPRVLPYLAKGFLEGCITYFGESLSIQMRDVSTNDGTHFIIQKVQV
ncbi:MAG: hypothetical protein HKP62_00875 [Sulfurovum sp.]|nr:heme NO-binding domain-containing protein [Sulfurovum sp.]NNJ44546.1 hypothetical protein [Sulfurovum sp.]